MRRVLVILVLGIWISTLQAGELKIVTINIWSGLTYKGILKMGEYESKHIREVRNSILVSQLRSLNPDVIAVQEANKLPRYVNRLAQNLSMDRIYSVGLAGIRIGCLGLPTNLKEGDAILAKPEWQLTRFGTVRLSGVGIISNVISFHFSESNQAIIGKIVTNKGFIYIINVHAHAGLYKDVYWSQRMDHWINSGLYNNADRVAAMNAIDKDVNRRQKEIRKLLNWISKKLPQDAPVFLMGDFNASPDQDEIQWIREAGFIDTYSAVNGPKASGNTWDPENNINIQKHYQLSSPDTKVKLFKRLQEENRKQAKRIDYIFIRPGYLQIDIIESRVVLKKPEQNLHPSDHFGVLTKIHWKD
jgi:hypothetical protein